MTRNQRFRALFQNGKPFVCMGAFDAITAKLAEASGAQALFVSGFVACGVEAGEPDVGALSQRDMFEHICRVCRATNLPVFADADTRYGGMLDVQRTIRLWEEAGADGLYAHAVESTEQMREAYYAAGCDTRVIADRLTPFEAYNNFVGLPDALAREARFTQV